MANKRRSSFFSMMKNLIFIIPNLFSLCNHVLSLSVYEAKQAVKSLMVILILSFVVGALTTTTWLGLLAMFYIYLTSIHWTPLASIGLVLLVNVIVLAIVALIIFEVKKNMEFPATRRQLQVIKKIYTE